MTSVKLGAPSGGGARRLTGSHRAGRGRGRRLATLDRFSEGRLIAGIGQGWMEQEFEAAGVSMKRRDAGFEEHLLAMRAV
jgi:hypothetical protein